MIVEDKKDRLKTLQEYALKMYSSGLPKMTEQDIMEYIVIINNRIEKLRIMSINNDPSFYSLYYLSIEKIRRLYHSIHGLPKINTSKVYKIYKNEEYRQTFFEGEFVSDEFKKLYFRAIEDTNRDERQLLSNIEAFYSYVRDDREIPDRNFRIKIKSRNK